MLRKLIEPIAMPLLRRATRGYVAGDELKDALDVSRAAAAHGYAVTICYWQPPDEAPEQVAQHYLGALDKIAAEDFDGRLAIKVPALHEREDLVNEIVAHAGQIGVNIDFDSHAPEQADAVYSVAEAMTDRDTRIAGCAIPGRWPRSLDDAERAIALGLRIRVVKGSWPDPEHPHMDMREGFLNVIDRIAGRAREVGVATHDAWLAREAMRRLTAAGTRCEQELLFGLPLEPAAAEGRKARIPARIYISYGSAWLPYSVSRAFSNPRVIAWLARDFFTKRSVSFAPPR